MARYIGPKCKLSRSQGVDLGLKSRTRPIETKCQLEKPPGQHGDAHGSWRGGRRLDYTGTAGAAWRHVAIHRAGAAVRAAGGADRHAVFPAPLAV